MDLLPYLHRQFAYNGWANQETIDALRKARPAPPRSLQYIAHIVSAEWLWLGRMKQWKQAFEVWPTWTLDQCEAQGGKLPPLWQDLLGELKAPGLGRDVEYTNSKGEDWSSTIGDILAHVLLHSAYHRGQIASDMRAAGLTPPYTDYIHAARQGLLS